MAHIEVPRVIGRFCKAGISLRDLETHIDSGTVLGFLFGTVTV